MTQSAFVMTNAAMAHCKAAFVRGEPWGGQRDMGNLE